MKIILFRHGEKQKSDSTDNNIRRSVCLTPKGISQIKALGVNLEKKFPALKKLESIYSSRFTRTIQSAEIIREILDIKEIVPIQELEEFYPIDDYTKDKDYRQGLMKKALIDPTWVGPNGKSLKNTLDKLTAFILNLPKADYIVISTHGALIRTLAYSISPELRPPDDEIVHSGIKEGGYTILESTGSQLNLVEFNI